MAKYHISFDTKDMKPAIKSVTVELKHEITLDMQAKFNIALASDPLYPALVAYVKANPLKGPRR